MPHFTGLRKLFGIDHTVTADELKKAYRNLSRKYHPDLNPGEEAEKMMKKVATAYEILTDAEKAKVFVEEQKEKRRAEIRAMEKKKKVLKTRRKKK